jgi:cytochrome c556
MKSRIRLLALVACGLLLVSIHPTAAQDKPEIAPEKASAWMKQKLELSQNILAGLTQGDFEAVELNAQRMNIVNYLEKWMAADKPQYADYKRQLSYFELANREILRQAKAKNIEGAMLAYNQLSISCVQCHQVVRDTKKK